MQQSQNILALCVINTLHNQYFYRDINGILICYKTGMIPARLPPPVPSLVGGIKNESSEVEKALNRLNLNNGSRNPKQPVSCSSIYEMTNHCIYNENVIAGHML